MELPGFRVSQFRTRAISVGVSVADMDGGDEEDPRWLALASWPEQAHARVVSQTVVGDRCEVVVNTEPDYTDYFYCQRDRHGRWRESVSGNGPCDAWTDPSIVVW